MKVKSVRTDDDLLALTSESRLQDVRDLNLRNLQITDFERFCDRLLSLELLSLSHNQLQSLQGFDHLRNLRDLNVNNNDLSSLVGIEQCCHLESLHACNNQLRDIEPLSGMPALRVLELVKNPIAAFDATVAILSTLPSLHSLDVSSTPLCGVPGYQEELLTALRLSSLNGNDVSTPATSVALGERDYARHAAPPRPASASQSARRSHDALPSTSSQVMDCAAGEDAFTHEPTQHSGRSSNGYIADMQTRPGTSSGRPGSSSGRPGSSGTGGSQLYANDFLNDHPILLEYLVKHVLAEGISLTQASDHGGDGGSPSTSASAAAAPPRLKTSFVNRLRGSAATSTSMQFLEPHELVVAHTAAMTASNAAPNPKAEAVETLITAATPHETIRQLVKLCEVLIKEVETARSGARPASASSSGGSRPNTAGSVAANGHVKAVPAGPGDEVTRLQGEVERLNRDVKQLRAESANLFSMAEENKRLKAQLAKLQTK